MNEDLYNQAQDLLNKIHYMLKSPKWIESGGTSIYSWKNISILIEKEADRRVKDVIVIKQNNSKEDNIIQFKRIKK